MTTVYARYAILDGHEPKQQPIEVEVWEPNLDKPGYLRFVRMKTVQEVYDELKARLEADDLLPDDYFQISSNFRYLDEYRDKKLNEIPIPQHHWRIIAFAVRGTSEGYYVHIGTILGSGQYQDLFLGKSFQGMEYALKVANACTRHMDN